jgi:glutathione synthase/RimK-type ligase-like ATP-grasp enzyme
VSKLYIVVDSQQDWEPFFPSEDVITADYYLRLPPHKGDRVRVINLCNYSWRLGSKGYYTSLLGEARGHSVIPSVRTLNSLRNHSSFTVIQETLHDQSAESLKKLASGNGEGIELLVFFGETSIPELADIARNVFDAYPCPVLRIELRWRDGWRIESVRQVAISKLNDEQQTAFADALDRYSVQIWRKAKSPLIHRYDLAILVNPEEKLPPSDRKALDKFIRVGRKMDIDVELISRKDIRRLAEFDMLFIRETTALDNHTFQFARRAEAEGLAVIDDPQSITRCTNKVYLMELFAHRGVPTLKTRLLLKNDPQTFDKIAEELGYPLVLKIPDGSFSRGIVKINDASEREKVDDLFKQSAVLLAQEYLYTEFDWRIGVLHGKPLYACQYFMARNHWQIYDHSTPRLDSGDFKTMPTYEAPRAVVSAAVKAATLIGDGLYGVDVKQTADRVAVIEVNDNPSIESGIEDQFLGDELYRLILDEFISRVEQRESLATR